MGPRATGFLILAAVTVAGICFVERDAGTVRGRTATDDRLLRIVIGGERRPGDENFVPPPPPQPLQPGTAPLKAASSARYQPPAPRFEHVIAPGDTPTAIAIAYLGDGSQATVKRILDANGIKSAKALKIGVKIVIPVARFETRIADGKRTLADLATMFYGKADRVGPLRRANPDLDPAANARIPRGALVYIPR
jgi:hypothetical protein